MQPRHFAPLQPWAALQSWSRCICHAGILCTMGMPLLIAAGDGYVCKEDIGLEKA